VQNQSAWKVLVMVVSIILTAACATFLIAIITMMCWRKHKCKFLTEVISKCVYISSYHLTVQSTLQIQLDCTFLIG